MINLKHALQEAQEKYGIKQSNFIRDFTGFLVANNWFEYQPNVKDGIVEVPDNFLLLSPIKDFIKNYDISLEEKIEILQKRLKESMPDTELAFSEYMKLFRLSDKDKYTVLDFFCYFLRSDIFEITQDELDAVVNTVFDSLNKYDGDLVISFFNWCKQYSHKYISDKRTVKYNKVYISKSRSKKPVEAYSENKYLNILFYLFNQDYIANNKMYLKAAQSSRYANAWLFLCLHFIDAIRDKDLLLIKHPDITMPPEDVLLQIKNNTFSAQDAKSTLYSVYWNFEYLLIKPNKTKKYDVPKINFYVPSSLEEHMGRLFAISEAHARIENRENFIRPVKAYEDITKILGEEIGNLFFDADFNSRSSNKTFMQLIESMTDDVLNEKSEFHVKGYMLASLARSHKSSYGDFAKTTAIYLKDAKLNGFTPTFVAREMMERGTLSFIPVMLLQMISDFEFDKLTVKDQTSILSELDMSLVEINDASMLSQLARSQSSEIVKEIYNASSKEDIINILHRIGNGQAVSKVDGCLCVLSAMHYNCVFPDRHGCVGCPYEISTKSTAYMLAQEYIRLSESYKHSKSEVMKEKYKTLLTNTVIPALSTLVDCAGSYSESLEHDLNAIIQSAANNAKTVSKTQLIQ